MATNEHLYFSYARGHVKLERGTNMPGSTRAWSRRDFLKLFPTVLGSTILACSTVEQRAGGPPPLSPGAPPTLEPSTFAETIFMNGKVVTMDAADTIVQAVAIKDGLILKTGSNEALRSLTGPKTKVIDLRGRTLTPG